MRHKSRADKRTPDNVISELVDAKLKGHRIVTVTHYNNTASVGTETGSKFKRLFTWTEHAIFHDGRDLSFTEAVELVKKHWGIKRWVK